MFITSQYLLSVICLTIVTLTRSSSTEVDSNDISKVLQCSFMANYASDTKRYCSKVDLDQYEDKFNRIYYACMELYDVSLQLCEIKDTKSEPGSIPLAKDFCKELKFYDKKAKSTEHWADKAVKFFSNPANCEKVCISENAIHPICEAMYAGNAILLKTEEERQLRLSQKTVARTDVSATTQSQRNQTLTETQSNIQHDPASNDKESPKTNTSKSTKLGDPKEEVKSNPNIHINPLAGMIPEKKLSEERLLDTIKGGEDSTLAVTDKKGEPERTLTENAPAIIPAKAVDDSQSSIGQQQIAEQESLDNVPQTPERKLPESSQSLSPAAASPSVTPSANPEAFDKYPAADHDDNRDSSKDLELESDGNGEDYTGPSILTQEESSNIYASDEPADNQVIASNVFSSNYAHSQDSHFFAYFLTMVVICIIGYLVFHNKQKIIALALEGRRMQGSRRRPNTSSYKKLDSNLEEAVTSNCSSSSVTHVIF